MRFFEKTFAILDHVSHFCHHVSPDQLRLFKWSSPITKRSRLQLLAYFSDLIPFLIDGCGMKLLDQLMYQVFSGQLGERLALQKASLKGCLAEISVWLKLFCLLSRTRFVVAKTCHILAIHEVSSFHPSNRGLLGCFLSNWWMVWTKLQASFMMSFWHRNQQYHTGLHNWEMLRKPEIGWMEEILHKL